MVFSSYLWCLGYFYSTVHHFMCVGLTLWLMLTSSSVIANYHLPSVLLHCLSSVHCYSICFTVFYLVPLSIMDSNTGLGHTCLLSYCVWLEFTSCRMLFTNLPPFFTIYDLCQQVSGIHITIDVCGKGFTHCYRLTYCVITYSAILLLKYGFGLSRNY